jgi:hypothetical protein
MMGIEAYDQITGDDAGQLWDMYCTAFEQINRLAVQRHLMTRDEFEDMLADKRVTKYVTVDQAKWRPAAMAVITNDLSAWPLISPDYFEYRWPALYAQRRIWYCGFVATAQGEDRPPAGVFGDLIATMAEPIVAARGVCAMDYCAVNVTRNLPALSDLLLRRRYPSEVHERIDQQSFYAYFPAGRPDDA